MALFFPSYYLNLAKSFLHNAYSILDIFSPLNQVHSSLLILMPLKQLQQLTIHFLEPDTCLQHPKS